MMRKNDFAIQYAYTKKKTNYFELVIYFFICLLIIRLIIFNICYGSAVVVGHSMNPTLNNGNNQGDMVVISKHCSYDYSDIVVLDGNKISNSSSGEDNKDLIKRIVAMGGDEITWELVNEEWKVFINGEALVRDYEVISLMDNDIKGNTLYKEAIIGGIQYDRHPFNRILRTQSQYFEDKNNDGKLDTLIVPENYVYVLGDNRPDSFDSKAFGVISKDCLQGKVVRIYSGGLSIFEFFFRTLLFW